MGGELSPVHGSRAAAFSKKEPVADFPISVVNGRMTPATSETITAIATGAIAVVAAIQAALFIWQLILIRCSLADSKKAADAARRGL
jgi:hypothetical protein